MSEQPRRARPQDIGVEVVELRVDRSAVATAVPAAENHLGDRLAAFVDGELDHDARERVQSHLATCDDCLARAEDERRVKSRVGAAAPPDPSALFLSKLISIAGDQDERPPGSDGGGQSRRFGGSAFGSGGATGGFGSMTGGWGSNGFGSGRFGSGALGAEHPVPGMDPRAERRPFQDQVSPIAARLRSGFAPSGSSSASALVTGRPQGFDEDQERGAARNRPSAARGRRFAFAAAGAFSVAAVALGSAITGVTAAEPTVDEPYGSVTPAAENPGGTVGGDYGRGTGQLAFGLVANNAPANARDYSAPYGSQFGNGALAPAASATSLPTGGYAAGVPSPLR
ncbi:anti-sigma factor [Streptacidiphilus sp. N1-3]|uniref:Anti-sigma factor n=1 Tax=Streptacidiphilus alkalitolerans TaxID=3342712 RepID=A0ABV6X3J1_9ACTN